MKVFRIKYLTRAFSLFIGVIFLNLSFMLAEISALKIDRNREMAQYLSILIANSMTEEEPGAADEDTTVPEIDIISHQHPNTGIFEDLSAVKYHEWELGQPCIGELEIFNPPPEA